MPCIYSWPDSQICMDCKHGQFLMELPESSSYLCMVDCDDNNGVECPKMEETENDTAE